MATYQLISSVTVGSGGASNIDFNNIPQTYTDLLIKVSARLTGSGTSNYIGWRFNGSTASDCIARVLTGDGSTAASATQSSADTIYLGLLVNDGGSTANTFSNTEGYFPNYTGSNNKSVSNDSVREGNASYGDLGLGAGLRSNTAAITRLQVIAGGGVNLAQYTTAYLYGIKNS